MKSSLQLQNDLSELKTLQTYLFGLEKKWQLDKKTVTQLNLVLDELVTNIIEHNSSEGGTFIEIHLAKKKKVLNIKVIDDGPLFDPTKCKLPDTTLPLQERRCGGLGILLVRKFSDNCSYKRKDNKNVFTIRKSLPMECR